MKFLAVVTPLPAIYHGFSTRKALWEEKFKPVNMISCGRHNVRKHREIKNNKPYIALDISLKLDSLYNREITSSESRDCMGRSGKGLTNSLTVRTKRPNIKIRQGLPLLTSITNISVGFSRSLSIRLILVTNIKMFIIDQMRITSYS